MRVNLLAFLAAAILLSSISPLAAQDPDFQTAAVPVEVMAYADTGRAVSKEIKAAEGGEIVATAEDGTRYRLVFPGDSVPYDVTVTLAPWTDVSGFDDAPLIGFDVQPTGMILLNPAIAYIEPGDNAIKQASRADVLFFETNGEYRQQARIALTPKGGFGLYLFHFSGGGVFSGSEQVAQFFVPPPGQLDGFLDLAHRQRVSGLSDVEVMKTIEGWQRRVEQDRQAGRIGDFKADEQLRIMDHLVQQVRDIQAEDWRMKAEQVLRNASDQAADRQQTAFDNAEGMAASGNWLDRHVFLQTISEWIAFERQQEFLGRQRDSRSIAEIRELVEKFGENVARRCDAEVINPGEALTIARLGLLLGADDSTGSHWNDVVEKLRSCKPKVSLDEAIERCFESGNYRVVVDLYSWLLNEPGGETLAQIDLPGPDKRSSLKQKVLEALSQCAVYEVKLKVNSEVRERESYASNTDPRQPSDEVSVTWHWENTTVATFSPATYAGQDEVMAGTIKSPEQGELSACNCTIIEPGLMTSCKISVCKRFDVADAELSGIDLFDFIFAGDNLESLKFHSAPSNEIYRNTCYVIAGERYCGDVGGSAMTLLGCLDKEMSSSGWPIAMSALAGSAAWRGEFTCGPHVVWADEPPDDGYYKQYEKGEIEIRHIRSR